MSDKIDFTDPPGCPDCGWRDGLHSKRCRKYVNPTNVPMTDKPKTTLADGSLVTPDHREINPETGQQKGYVVLSEEERKKGFIRPVRQVYLHLTCKTTTRMGLALSETYARDPKFYSGTFCVTCKNHFPLDQFWWEGTNEIVGS